MTLLPMLAIVMSVLIVALVFGVLCFVLAALPGALDYISAGRALPRDSGRP